MKNASAFLMLPCPKCGEHPEAVKSRSFWYCVCKNHPMHPVKGHTMHTKGEAVAAWNILATPKVDTGELPELTLPDWVEDYNGPLDIKTLVSDAMRSYALEAGRMEREKAITLSIDDRHWLAMRSKLIRALECEGFQICSDATNVWLDAIRKG